MKTTLLGLALLEASIVFTPSCSSSNSTTRPETVIPCVPKCSGGATCALGRCLLTLASGQNQPSSIVVSDPDLYWTSSGPCPTDGGSCQDKGTVSKVPTEGGNPTTLASEQNVPWAVFARGTSVYWVNDNAAGTVMSMAGGDAESVASRQDNPDSIAVDGTSVYWTNAGTLGADGIVVAGTGAVMKAPLGGGAPTTLASDQNLPHGVVVNATSVYWADEGGATSGVSGTVMSVTLQGGTPESLAGGQDVASLAVDSANVYWTSAGSVPYSGTVMRYSLSGGVLTTIASGQSLPNGIAIDDESVSVDERSVYWVTEAGDVLTCPLKKGCPPGPDGGTAPSVLASGQNSPASIAVDATSVYWTNFADPGTVMKVTPKGALKD